MQPIKQKSGLTLLEIDLETGRYHQIRAQLSAIGCPVFGDRKYGSSKTFENGIIGLQHFKLEIPHPISKEWMKFEILQSNFENLTQ